MHDVSITKRLSKEVLKQTIIIMFGNHKTISEKTELICTTWEKIINNGRGVIDTTI